MKRLFVLVLVLAFMMVPVSALADTTYLEDDFEGYSIGEYPSIFLDTGTSSPERIIQVVNQGGSQMFFTSINDTPESTFGHARSVANFTPHPSETQITWEFTYMSMLQDNYTGLALGVPNNYLSVYILSDGSLQDEESGLPIAPPATVQAGVYYDVKVVYDVAAQTFDVYVDDVQYLFDIPSAFNGYDEGSLFMVYAWDINTNALPVAAYIDNLLITGAYTDPVNPRTGDGSIAREMLVKQ